MKTFTSFAASTLAAASTLMFVALSTPAQACNGCSINLNGPVLQGPILQGVTLQGPVLQGPVVQGPVVQGPVVQGPIIQGPLLQGPVATGTHVGKFVAVTLPSGETISVR